MNEGIQGAVYVDGAIVAPSEARISVYDHSVLYGDGIFETFRVADGQVFRMDAHFDRLTRSARGLHLDLPMPVADMGSALRQTVAASGLRDCYVKLVVTRGAG